MSWDAYDAGSVFQTRGLEVGGSAEVSAWHVKDPSIHRASTKYNLTSCWTQKHVKVRAWRSRQWYHEVQAYFDIWFGRLLVCLLLQCRVQEEGFTFGWCSDAVPISSSCLNFKRIRCLKPSVLIICSFQHIWFSRPNAVATCFRMSDRWLFLSSEQVIREATSSVWTLSSYTILLWS